MREINSFGSRKLSLARARLIGNEISAEDRMQSTEYRIQDRRQNLGCREGREPGRHGIDMGAAGGYNRFVSCAQDWVNGDWLLVIGIAQRRSFSIHQLPITSNPKGAMR